MIYAANLQLDVWLAQLQRFSLAPQELVAKRDAVAAFAQSHWNWDTCADTYMRLLAEPDA